jgi:predicted anti-sigma-YlaC factor YlaD
MQVECAGLAAALETLDEQDTEGAERLIEEHLRNCPECQSEERELAAMMAGFRNTPEDEISLSLVDRIVTRLCGRASSS